VIPERGGVAGDVGFAVRREVVCLIAPTRPLGDQTLGCGCNYGKNQLRKS
jgi:hypothetical protein